MSIRGDPAGGIGLGGRERVEGGWLGGSAGVGGGSAYRTAGGCCDGNPVKSDLDKGKA